MEKYDRVDLVATPNSEFHKRARELLQEAKMKDAGKVMVKHPILPNTWLMVSPERAKMLTQGGHE